MDDTTTKTIPGPLEYLANRNKVQKLDWEDKLDLVQKSCCPGAPRPQFELYIYRCKTLGLNPLLRQAYLIPYKNKDGSKTWSFQVGIDGFRNLAQQTGQYAGGTEPEWDETDKILTCKIGVKKLMPGSIVETTYHTVYFDEYLPPPHKAKMWQKMPHTMIAKVCEAICLRRCFPHVLSGIYIPEEMDQADRDGEVARPTNGIVVDVTPSDQGDAGEVNAGSGDTSAPTEPAPPPDPKDSRNKLYARIAMLSREILATEDKPKRLALCQKWFKSMTSMKDLSVEELSSLADELNKVKNNTELRKAAYEEIMGKPEREEPM